MLFVSIEFSANPSDSRHGQGLEAPPLKFAPPKRFGPPKYCRGQGPPNSRVKDVVYEKIESAAQPKIFMKMEC